MPNARQDDLFASGEQPEPASRPQPVNLRKAATMPSGTAAGPPKPLAARMRPRSLAEVVGQDHITGEGCLLPKLVAADRFGSILLYGPPGCGKTTIAEAIAFETRSRFVRINAVLSNVAEMRDVLKMARARPEDRTVLFIDEIHRFNKAQQDLLLPDVEQGNIRLIGATTHNPGFYVIPPLLSRSHLFRLQPVEAGAVAICLRRAMTDAERGVGDTPVTCEEGVLEQIAKLANGDLRWGLNALETLVLSMGDAVKLTHADVAAFAAERNVRYDANEDEHYDTASAYIKSMRGGDPDAALYWLAKMLAGGENPRFIARRLVILASEDIGLANAQALPLAVATFQAVDFVGLPECELNLAHATLFLTLSPKSNSATTGIGAAKAALRDKPQQAVPNHLRDSHTKFNKSLGQGKDYQYSHGYPEAISGQDYLEKPLSLYHPGSHGEETAIAERLKRWRELKASLQP